MDLIIELLTRCRKQVCFLSCAPIVIYFCTSKFVIILIFGICKILVLLSFVNIKGINVNFASGL